MIRTSYSHPLRIDTIQAGGGQLGLSICPGKVQTQSHTGGWNRNLFVDLDAVHRWGARTVITLLEQDELIALKVPGLGNGVMARGMNWIHLPLPNDTVPNAAWIAKFQALQPGFSNRIIRGEGVFIHCMGGIGRTSVAAALLLLHAGWTAEKSIAAIHQARRGSFVMQEQEDFVHTYAQTLQRPAAPKFQP